MKYNALIKFVSEVEHAEILQNGDLFTKAWQYYKGLEDSERGDKLELVASRLSTIVSIPLLNMSFSINLEDEFNRFTPVFCMYSHAILDSPENKIILYNNKLRDFGEYALIIDDIHEFYYRVKENLFGFSFGMVEYSFFNRYGAIRNPILTKSPNYSHQNEFRIYNHHIALTNDLRYQDMGKKIYEPNNLDAGLFSVGDISDISKIYSIDDLFNGIDFKYKSIVDSNQLNYQLWWDGEQYKEIEKNI